MILSCSFDNLSTRKAFYKKIQCCNQKKNLLSTYLKLLVIGGSSASIKGLASPMLTLLASSCATREAIMHKQREKKTNN